MSTDERDESLYKVVLNHEEQYSIWPADRDNPPGWRDEGKQGTRQECLDHIDVVWTDMRPLSLRKSMEAAAAATTDPDEGDLLELPEEDLVERLCHERQPVAAALPPGSGARDLQEAIERGYVRIAFPNTRGGTELGVHLDAGATDVTGADFEAGTGRAHLEGDLTLDFQPVRCVATIELSSLEGEGQLVRR